MATKHYPTGPKCFGLTQKKCWFDQGDKSSPGPGTHEINRMDRTSPPRWKLGQESNQLRDAFLAVADPNDPSPQEYRPSMAVTVKDSSKMSIPKAKKHYRLIQNMARLYQPSIKSTIPQLPHFSFGYANPIEYATIVPGPGQYDTQDHKHKFNKTQRSFSLSNRHDAAHKGSPGPGTYLNDHKQTYSQFSFSKSPRSHMAKIDDASTTFYNIGQKRIVPRRSNRLIKDTQYYTKPQDLFPASDLPSPSTYNTLLPSKILHGVIVKSGRKDTFDINSLIDNPSPHNYTIRKEIQSDNGCSFPRQQGRFKHDSFKAPSPDTYTLKSCLAKQGGAIGKMQLTQKQNQTPSAAQYRPSSRSVKHKAQSSVVLKADRIDFSLTTTKGLGPGSYQLVKDKSGQLGKMGKSSRVNLHIENGNPGAGDYDIPSSIGKLPSYYSSPRKMNISGYSAHHQKINNINKMLKQKQKKKQMEQAKLNPEGETVE